MKTVALVLVGFLVIGLTVRAFTGKTRLALLLFASGMVLYVTIKYGM